MNEVVGIWRLFFLELMVAGGVCDDCTVMMGCDEESAGSSVTRAVDDCDEVIVLAIVEAGRAPAKEPETCDDGELLFFLCCRDAREEETDKDLLGCEDVLEGVADIYFQNFRPKIISENMKEGMPC